MPKYKMRILAVLMAVAAAAAATTTSSPQQRRIVGRGKCTYGPSYWCHDLRQAAECGAAQHCADNYWPAMRLPPDNDDVCTICKNMVKQARDVLNSNQTLVSNNIYVLLS